METGVASSLRECVYGKMDPEIASINNTWHEMN